MAAFGEVPAIGSPGPRAPHLVGIAASPTGAGYWALDEHGRVLAYGSARKYNRGWSNNLGSRPVAIAAAPDGKGYWVVSAAGGVFTHGDARYFGSLGKTALKSPVVGMGAVPSGRGYWLVTAAGGVYSFGSAGFFGSLGKVHLGSPVIGIAVAPGGRGYWLATQQGAVFSFGDAHFFGSLNRPGFSGHVVTIAAPPNREGYWLLATNGAVDAFGAAPRLGRPLLGRGVEASALAPVGHGGYLVASSVAPRRHEPQSSVPAKAARATGPRQNAPGAHPRVAQTSEPLRTYLGTFLVTCYDLTGPTATGTSAGPDSVAVDPSVVPLGTELYIDGVGRRTADDTGGAIIGEHLDIWEPSYTACTDWGVQDRAVYRVSGG